MEPEILIVDEVLAVGDNAFQKKCLGKMDEVSRSGRTVMFVSHNMATILNLCEKVVLMEKGQLAYFGDCERGVELYADCARAAPESTVDLTDHPRRRAGCKPILAKVSLLNKSGLPTDQLICGEAVAVELTVDPRCSCNQPHFAVGFDDTHGIRILTVATYLSDFVPTNMDKPRRVICRLDQLPLTPGRYCLTLNAGPQENKWTDFIDQAVWFDVIASDFYGNGVIPHPLWGHFLVRSRWETSTTDSSPSKAVLTQ
jgi:lipopolysaccharide transport system ATP-binding protein